MTNPTPIVRADGIAVRRGTRTLWRDLTFDVPAGASVVVTGPSGCGKSTLLHCLGGLDRVTTGTVCVAGRPVPVSGRHRSALFRSTVGHLLQDPALVDTWPVRANLDVAFIGTAVRRRDRPALRQQALARVGLAADERARTHTLSGGERQRLALARFLVRRPLVLFADEPTAALDDTAAGVVVEILDELRAAGTAVVAATHDPRLTTWADDRVDLGTVAP